MKNKDISIKAIVGPIIRGFQRYSVTIFIVVLVSGLATAVLQFSNILQESSNTAGYTPPATVTTFDQSTINRIEQLHTSSGFNGQVTLPTGRINPFAE